MDLVTGATGHIGNVLVRLLVERGNRVRALVLPGEKTQSLQGLDVEIVEGNVLDPASLACAMVGVTRVYHLAGMISILPGRNELVRRVNIEGTRNVVEAARAAGVQRMLYTSSIHALKRVPDGVMMDENLPFDPDNPVGEYDRSKAEASLAVLAAVRDGFDAVLVCPTGVIGPYDFLGSEMGHLLVQWMRKRVHWLTDGGYDFVDVRDVAQGMLLAMEKGQTGKTYILSGEKVRLGQLSEIIGELTGKRCRAVRVPSRLALFAANFTPYFYRLFNRKPSFTKYSIVTVTGNSTISSKRAQEELGYRPRSLRESIRDTLQWWKSSSQRSPAR